MAAQGSTHSGGVVRPAQIGDVVRSATSAIAHEWTSRRDHPWIGLVAVPLGMTAAGLLGQWWVWPVLTLDSALASRLAVGMDAQPRTRFVGTEWAFVGAYSLGMWPSSVVPIGVVWTAFPALLAVAVSRHRGQAILGAFRPASGVFPAGRPEQAAQNPTDLVGTRSA